MNKRSILAAALNITAFAVSILPAAICTCCYFPLWINRGPATIISGISLILILISAIPLFKLLRKHFTSASAYMVWLVLFVLFSAEMDNHSSSGSSSNNSSIGSILGTNKRKATNNDILITFVVDKRIFENGGLKNV